MYNLNKFLMKLEEPGCLYSISEQKFKHQSASTAAVSQPYSPFAIVISSKKLAGLTAVERCTS